LHLMTKRVGYLMKQLAQLLPQAKLKIQNHD
jgi:hypothetical protein